MEAINIDQARSLEDHVTIDIAIDANGLATELENLMSDNLFMPPECCIFRVPTILYRHNEKAYAPNAFSVGPFYYKQRPLMEATQKIKLKYLRGLINRSRSSPQTRLRDFVTAVTEVKESARGCYGGPIDISMKEFVQVMVLDGCFIIELFRKNAYEELKDQDDPIFEMSCLRQFLFHDLIMLENQIPWVVLDTLFNLTFITRIDKKPLIRLATEFFGTVFSTQNPYIDPQPLLSRPTESKHILDMLRNSLLWSDFDLHPPNLNWTPMPSVTSLKEAGIKFKKRESKSILDIKFEEGVLEIPSLLIQETTEPLFRNLISLEQCCPGYKPVITSYAILMDNLINTKDDVQMLSQQDVLENWLNVEEATKFFNELYTDTFVKEYYYFPLNDKVHAYCKRRWPKYRTVLMRDYFKHPWAFISFAVATFLVICAFTQTLFSIIK